MDFVEGRLGMGETWRATVRPSTFRFWFGAAILASSVGCATAASSEPPAAARSASASAWAWDSPLRLAHIDNIAPQKFEQFEQARLEWLRAESEAAVADRRGLFLQVGKTRFITLRPIGSLGDLDRSRPSSKESPAVVAARARYDRLSDEALVAPHASEIWEHEDEVDYPGLDPRLMERTAAASIMVVEQLHPTPEHGGGDYVEAWNDLKKALTEGRYPLRRVTYRARFGSGAVISLWLAHSREEILSAPTLEAAAASVVGAEKAREIMRRIEECLAGSERLDVAHRRDLSSPGM
jgi:hypothetical protein